MNYTPVFTPNKKLIGDFRDKKDKKADGAADARDGKFYLYTDEIVLAVNVALVTGRPLLVSGLPGCGKSSLAYNIARCLNRRYCETVITSRTEAEDLLWNFNAVGRLADVQADEPRRDTQDYVDPGVLWWVFDPVGALKNGKREESTPTPFRFLPDNAKDLSVGYKPSVLLLDEIDKADPDLPNNLLVVLGSQNFVIRETREEIDLEKVKPEKTEDRPLIIITTNGERKLPSAFRRRCVSLQIKDPTKDRLHKIVNQSSLDISNDDFETIFNKVLEAEGIDLEKVSKAPKKEEIPVSIAEFMDVARAFARLREVNEETLEKIIVSTIVKKVDVSTKGHRS